MNGAKSIKRLAIFVIYDRDGIIDDYIPYYLNSLCPNVSRLVIVCNGKLTEDGRAKLTAFTDDVFVRPNVGFDAGAVKNALFDYIGWEEIYQYDELLIANDTLYGPFCPFKQIFDEMDKRDVDFWGLAWHDDHYYDGGFGQSSKIFRKGYLQSYFLNVKNGLLRSNAFRSFWDKLIPESLTLPKIIKMYEMNFTYRFLDDGFTCATYSDTIRYASGNITDNYNVAFLTPLDIAEHGGLPFIKKKSFVYNPAEKICIKSENEPNAVMNYVEQKTDYDANLIWDNLLRTVPAAELTEKLKIRFVLPANISSGHLNNRGAVIIDLKSGERMKEIDSLVDGTGLDIIGVDNVSEYDYACYINDSNHYPQETRSISIQAALSGAWQNALASREYVDNVIRTFEENPRLGILTAPNSYHSRYVEAFIEEVQHNNAVWFRTSAIKVNDFEKSDFAEEARKNGYYSGIVMTAEHAAVRSADFEYMLSDICGHFLETETFLRISKIARMRNIQSFCELHSPVYLYGTGFLAEQWTYAIQQENISFFGYVISDGRPKPDEYMGGKVYYLSEITDKQCGIILTLDARNTKDVLPLLAQRGFENILQLN